MTDAEKLKVTTDLLDGIERCPEAYLIVGDCDKPFHRPECERDACEHWRTHNQRPTRAEVRNRIGGRKE